MKNTCPARQLLRGYSWPFSLPEHIGMWCCAWVNVSLLTSWYFHISLVHLQKYNYFFPTGRGGPKPSWRYCWGLHNEWMSYNITCYDLPQEYLLTSCHVWVCSDTQWWTSDLLCVGTTVEAFSPSWYEVPPKMHIGFIDRTIISISKNHLKSKIKVNFRVLIYTQWLSWPGFHHLPPSRAQWPSCPSLALSHMRPESNPQMRWKKWLENLKSASNCLVFRGCNPHWRYKECDSLYCWGVTMPRVQYCWEVWMVSCAQGRRGRNA